MRYFWLMIDGIKVILLPITISISEIKQLTANKTNWELVEEK